jgi:PEP-CTERM motif
MNIKMQHALAAALLALSATASAGPVILGGDDLTDHGSRSAAGVNLEGWLYIEKAVSNVLSGQTRAGALTTDIAVLGAASTGGVFAGGNAGAAIGSAALNLGKSVTYFDTAAGINSFFAALAAGTINPGMIWIAGDGAVNDVDAAEGAALTANAAAINTFVSSGGGLMSHGSGSDVYGWLTTLLPGIVEVQNCNSSGATLTAAGQAAFPGLTNANVDANAGPCHSSFTGNFGGLTTLAFDGDQRSYIIGGGSGTVIQCGQTGQPVCPTNNVPEPGTLALLGIGAVGFAGLLRRRRRS